MALVVTSVTPGLESIIAGAPSESTGGDQGPTRRVCCYARALAHAERQAGESLRSHDYGVTAVGATGIWLQSLPSRMRPVRFLFVPPHCLKKNGTPA